MPELYMIGGPNGAGKTTSAFSLLPKILDCDEYVNADSIAAALSPFQPEKQAMQAGRLMLTQLQSLAQNNKNFAFETTMASRSFAPFLEKCIKQGYAVNLLFLYLNSDELAKQRVAVRVASGGHNIPAADVERRYERGLFNFFNLYLPLANKWGVYDNSLVTPELIAENEGEYQIICNKSLWQKLWDTYHE